MEQTINPEGIPTLQETNKKPEKLLPKTEVFHISETDLPRYTPIIEEEINKIRQNHEKIPTIFDFKRYHETGLHIECPTTIYGYELIKNIIEEDKRKPTEDRLLDPSTRIELLKGNTEDGNERLFAHYHVKLKKTEIELDIFFDPSSIKTSEYQQWLAEEKIIHEAFGKAPKDSHGSYILPPEVEEVLKKHPQSFDKKEYEEYFSVDSIYLTEPNGKSVEINTNLKKYLYPDLNYENFAYTGDSIKIAIPQGMIGLSAMLHEFGHAIDYDQLSKDKKNERLKKFMEYKTALFYGNEHTPEGDQGIVNDERSANYYLHLIMREFRKVGFEDIYQSFIKKSKEISDKATTTKQALDMALEGYYKKHPLAKPKIIRSS